MFKILQKENGIKIKNTNSNRGEFVDCQELTEKRKYKF